jgi:hypothetical protein
MAEQNRIEFAFGGKICFGESLSGGLQIHPRVTPLLREWSRVIVIFTPLAYGSLRVPTVTLGLQIHHPRGVIQHREACSDTFHRMSYLLANRNRTPL